jgi:uncharacterized protein YyaL (SSP411 family)
MRLQLLFFLVLLAVSCNSDRSSNSSPSPNHLINETSPYLLQHVYNPVDWYPWGDEALNKAKNENKMLVISIGFSSCHWCHVMEKETFSNDSVANLMNKNFVSIKVDKEERPDVDMTYMKAANLTLGGGGWPLNIVALPDGRPVFINTYLPKENWMSALQQMVSAYQSDKQKMVEYADYLAKGMAEEFTLFDFKNNDANFSLDDYQKACLSISESIDKQSGGLLGTDTKFPTPSILNLLLQNYFDHPDEELKAIILNWLYAMARGGIYDQLGGGFSRYSTDKNWTVPHFEKMLYDNAQLLSIYSKAYQVFKEEEFRNVITEISSFVKEELKSPSGGFYSSIDSESDGEEGKYYAWSFDEFKNAVGNDPIVIEYFGISEGGNFENKNVITRRVAVNDLSNKYLLSLQEIESKIEESEQKLLDVRKKRKRPSIDDKIITSWNALAIIGFIDAFQATGESAYLSDALQIADFIVKNQINKNQIIRINKNGKSSSDGLLDDYSNTLLAFIQLYQSTFDFNWLKHAEEVLRLTENNFEKVFTGLYSYSPKSGSKLIVENYEILDDALASSNSQLAWAKFYLGKINGNTSLVEESKKMLVALKQQVLEEPVFYSNWARLIGALTSHFYEVAIVGKDCDELKNSFLKEYYPYKVTLGGKKDNELETLNGKLVMDKTLIYVCTDGYCKYPVSKIEDAYSLMETN